MSSAGRSLKVFLAEDSEAMRQRIQALLAGGASAIVGEGSTPRACIDAIQSLLPDVVVLDVRLDGGTGLEVLRAIHAALPGVAFVVFSNNSGSAYRKKYLQEGATRFLDKSTEFDQLARAVEAAGDAGH